MAALDSACRACLIDGENHQLLRRQRFDANGAEAGLRIQMQVALDWWKCSDPPLSLLGQVLLFGAIAMGDCSRGLLGLFT